MLTNAAKIRTVAGALATALATALAILNMIYKVFSVTTPLGLDSGVLLRDIISDIISGYRQLIQRCSGSLQFLLRKCLSA